MEKVLSWFEVPSTDLLRAKAFYETVLGIELATEDFNGFKMAYFPDQAGTIVQHEMYTPSHQGALLYFNGGDDLSAPLSRVEAAGGKILRGKTEIAPEYGHMAICEDTEGNRIALYSRS